MSMAEDTRYRPDQSSDHRSEPETGPADPLAELARLIGQSDPFADLKQRRASLAQEPQDDLRPAPGWLARAARSEEQSGFAEGSYAEPYAGYRAPDHQRAADPSAPAYDDYTAQPASAYAHDDRYAQDDRYAHDQQQPAAHYAAGPHADEHGDERYRVAPPAEYESDEYYDDGHLPPRAEGDVRGAGRRGGLITIAAVLGLAVIGTAGAFGYRAFTGPSSDAPPPVIRADPNPSKSAPATTADAQDKPFQDRVGTPGAVQTERIVPREEAPVAQPVPSPQPQQMAPLGAWPTPPPRTVGPVPPTAAVPPAVVPPKRVRTVTIKQEPDTTQTTPSSAVPPAAQPHPATPRATRPAPNAPMALAPATAAPEPVMPPARVHTTRVPPPATVAPEGAYVVQVSAQKTEGDAQASYRSLQQKYPAVLAGREASIRRADLGDKGVYYRAQVGPFTNAASANQFCDSLKSAGGQCIVQKN